MDSPGQFNGVPRERNSPPPALLTSWSELVSVLEGLAEAFFTLDREWRFTYLNPVTAAYLGRPAAELLGKCFWDECPELRGTGYETQLRTAAERSVPCVFELYDTARESWKELQVFPSATGVAVSCIDISKRKLSRDAERDNALRFQVVARATTDVIFDWDVIADSVWWSDDLPTVFGHDSLDFGRTFQGWADHVHPDDRERISNSFFEALRDGSGKWTGEYRFRRKDGSYADVYANTIIARDPNGNAIRSIGAMTDVTEKKRAEAERARNEARIRLQASLLDQAHDAISVTGVEGRISYWNRGAQRLFGWSEQEALGKSKAGLTGMSAADSSRALQCVMEHDEWIGEIVKLRKDDAGRTIGAEALLRWMHPGDAVLPSVFIPLAEETGLILRLGHWVLEAACRQLAAWAAEPAKAGLTLAVNVSPRQFRQGGFVDEVLELVGRTGADPHRLKLELTESVLIENVEHTVEHMNALKACGISFALDDFGTGYSSLAYLKRLPLNQLKIDRSFVRDVLTDPNDAAIARTIMGLGQTLGLDVIAEGVETRSQRDFLAAHGCRSYQGFFFGPPVTAEQFLTGNPAVFEIDQRPSVGRT